MARIIIDVSKDDHKRLKAISAVMGKSMRVVVIEALEQYLYKTDAQALNAVKEIEKDRSFLKKMSV